MPGILDFVNIHVFSPESGAGDVGVCEVPGQPKGRRLGREGVLGVGMEPGESRWVSGMRLRNPCQPSEVSEKAFGFDCPTGRRMQVDPLPGIETKKPNASLLPCFLACLLACLLASLRACVLA